MNVAAPQATGSTASLREPPARTVRRVLMTTDSVGGVWTYSLQLARGLAGSGLAVHLATLGAPLTADQRREAAAAPLASLHTSSYRLEWMDHPWDDVDESGRWLLALGDRISPDVVHLNGYAHGALPWRVPTVVVGHSCVCSWWWAVHREQPPAAWDRYRLRVAAGLEAASAVVVPTLAMLDSLRRWYAVDDAIVVPNGRDSSWAQGPAPAKEPLVLAAGRMWDEAKNLGALALAAPALPWPVVVAGPLRQPGAAADGQLPVPEVGEISTGREGGAGPASIRFLGPLPFEALAPWLRRAAVFAAPARYEPFGLAVLEAAQAGCALVLGDLASFREVWEDAALYVDPSDPDAISGAIEHLAGDSCLRRRLQRAATARAARYTTAAMASAMLQIYRHCGSHAHAGRPSAWAVGGAR